MYKINTKEKVKNLDGTDREETVGFTISEILGTTKTKDPIRSFVLAEKFRKEESVDLNESDLKFVKNVVLDENSQYMPYIVGQIAIMLENLKRVEFDGEKK